MLRRKKKEELGNRDRWRTPEDAEDNSDGASAANHSPKTVTLAPRAQHNTDVREKLERMQTSFESKKDGVHMAIHEVKSDVRNFSK